jgi:hypothetical protein
LAAIVKHCEPGAACYASVPGGPLLERFMRAFNASGFSLKHTLAWVKNQFVIGMSDYHFLHEPVLYGWIENGPHYFTDDRTQDSVFEVDKPHSSDLLSTMKPVELVARMIINSSRAGPCLGFLPRIRHHVTGSPPTRADWVRCGDRSRQRGRLPRKARRLGAGAEVD